MSYIPQESNVQEQLIVHIVYHTCTTDSSWHLAIPFSLPANYLPSPATMSEIVRHHLQQLRLLLKSGCPPCCVKITFQNQQREATRKASLHRDFNTAHVPTGLAFLLGLSSFHYSETSGYSGYRAKA